MQKLHFLSFLVLGILVGSCSVHNKSSFKPAMHILGELSNCEQDTIWLYSHDGIELVPSYHSVLDKTNSPVSFKMALPQLEKGFYFIGLNPNNSVPIVLGSEAALKFKGDCTDLKKNHEVLESANNTSYKEYSGKMAKLQQEFGQIMRQYGRTKDPGQIKSMNNRLGQIDRARLRLLDTLKINDPFMGNVLALSGYQSYQNNKESTEQSEIEYFGNSYFNTVDLQNPAYNRIPQLFEAFKGYSYSLGSAGIEETVLHQYLDQTLAKVPANTTAYKMALGGIVFGLESKSPSSFVNYGRKYLAEYPEANPSIYEVLAQKIDRSSSFIVGAVAPEIKEKTPDGTEMKLSDLRGKIVLIDFWASWCGPCRRANPEVVALYDKYKDLGFDILGVSLDRKRESWLAAIEKDDLRWHHVSDLQQWKSLPAQTYGVSSIPQTVLVDREGKILARNLKGKALEDKLKELLTK